MDIHQKIIDLISLKGKVALISGGASGIGLGTARRLAEAGAIISIIDINDENGAKAVKILEEGAEYETDANTSRNVNNSINLPLIIQEC